MAFALIMAGCVLFGLMVGRWWALLGAFALGVLMGIVIDPEELSKLYVGFVWAALGSLAIGLGVAIRRLARIDLGGVRRKRERIG